MQIIANLPKMKEGEFDHEYMAQHIEQLQMDPTLCSKCSPATKYFCSPEPVVQELYKKSCHWRQSPGSTLSMDIKPYNTLLAPYYYPQHLGIIHPQDRPRGQVHIKRVFQFPQGSKEFTHTAKMSSLSALKTLQNKPAMAKELTYKLRADVTNGVLLKLKDFLQLPEVKEAGLTMKNAQNFICPAPLHMVANVNSKSSPVRMVIAPHRQHVSTRKSINDSLAAGHHGLPSIQRTILRYRLSVSSSLADLSCYYKRSIIDPLGSLMSAIWLQGDDNSAYPFLDPTRSNKLELWVFRSPNFGFKDASSLAAAGKNMMGKFYEDHFPQGLHKLPKQDITSVADTLEKAFSDDVLNPVFLPMVEHEDKNPTFPHPDNWSQLTTEEKADEMVIQNQLKIISVADFSSHYFKEISSLSKYVEDTLNKDSRLDRNKPAEKRPPLETVLEEIKKTRSKRQTDTETKKAWRKKLIYLLSKEEEEIEVIETPDEPAKSDENTEVVKMSAKLAEGFY